MKLYSQVGSQRFWQIFGDLLLVAWVYVCVKVGLLVFRITNALGTPGRKTAEAGDGLAADLRRFSVPIGKVPAVGDELRSPIDGAAAAAARLAQAGRDQAHAVEQLAYVLAAVTIALPILFALLIWLPRRLRFIRRATAAQRFINNAADLDLFALRAMANQPMHKLARISDDPVTAWREGDSAIIRQLAALELRTTGLKPPPA
ncbi:hypothetical protein E1263_19525 [Kribbella antibiotica]|uniref:Transmembrane protein n=1 Tax=Kribbella antibiotica TaxID=190195 RepID=A0A4R4ZLB6_9ACTN|nr:hypothetical protein [Kribbella antibiotica]TDD58409.1 hypothetical protein E1263_19525 [Kribbella antibiotica]